MLTETLTEVQAGSLVTELAKIAGRENVLDRVEGRRKFTGDMSWLTIAAAAHGRSRRAPRAPT